MYIPGAHIGGWTIGPDGKWSPLPCRFCNGTKVISRPANPEQRAQGYDAWHEPCGVCRDHSVRVFESWVKSGAP